MVAEFQPHGTLSCFWFRLSVPLWLHPRLFSVSGFIYPSVTPCFQLRFSVTPDIFWLRLVAGFNAGWHPQLCSVPPQRFSVSVFSYCSYPLGFRLPISFWLPSSKSQFIFAQLVALFRLWHSILFGFGSQLPFGFEIPFSFPGTPQFISGFGWLRSSHWVAPLVFSVSVVSSPMVTPLASFFCCLVPLHPHPWLFSVSVFVYPSVCTLVSASVYSYRLSYPRYFLASIGCWVQHWVAPSVVFGFPSAVFGFPSVVS